MCVYIYIYIHNNIMVVLEAVARVVHALEHASEELKGAHCVIAVVFDP